MDNILFIVLHFTVSLFQCLVAFPTNHGNVTNCTIHPSSRLIPCTQYIFEGYESCNESELKRRFPELYTSEKREFATWPGPPKLIGKESRNITWTPSIDGGIHFLKGFQITLYGISFRSFDKTLCAVINLNGTNEATISRLMNATFEAHFDAPGDFMVNVQSLPPPDKGYTPVIEETLSKDNYTYHPNISVDIVVVQLNDSTINVSIEILPEVEEIKNYILEAFYVSDSTRNIRERIKAVIPSKKKYAVMGNLTTGNYTLKLQPENKFTSDTSRCVCYTGLPNSRSCVPCITYSKSIHIEPLLRNNSVTTEYLILEICIPTIAVLLLLFLMFLLLLRRAKLLTCCTGMSRTDTKQKSICFLHTTDNDVHDAAIQMFINYFKDTFKCIVVSQTDIPEINGDGEDLLRHLFSADLIVIVNSEVAYKLYNFFKTDCQCHFSQTFGPINDSFILCITKLIQKESPNLKNKLVSLHFDYTSRDFLFEEFQPCYKVLEDLDKLNQHIQSLLKQSVINVSDGTLYEELSKKITACKFFQASNPNWFNKTYRHITKSSFSSDDSGVEVQNNLIPLNSVSKCDCSMYSFYNSIERNSHRKCKQNNMIRGTFPQHLYRSASMQTRSSFCFSEVEKRFISPEFGDEKEDTPTELLTEQMRKINSRYDYIVSNELESDEDCFTVLGTSV